MNSQHHQTQQISQRFSRNLNIAQQDFPKRVISYYRAPFAKYENYYFHTDAQLMRKIGLNHRKNGK